MITLYSNMQDEPNDDVPTDKLIGPDPLKDHDEDSVEDSVENLHEGSVEDFLSGYLVDPLEAAKEIIQKWEKAMEDDPESLFLLNEAQCTKMWQNFRRVYNAFQPSSSYPREYKKKCLYVFIEFHNIVERGGAVMEMCTQPKAERGGAMQKMCNKQEAWLKAAILYGDNERMLQELSENLQLCVDCACKLTKSLSFTSSQKPLNHVDVALLPSQAKLEFKRDFARLKAKLEHLVKEYAGSENDEVHLAQYFLERQTFRSESDLEIQAPNVRQVCSGSQDPSPSKATLPGKYFEKNRHYPMQGDNHKAGGEGTVVCTVNWLGMKCFKKKFDKDGIDEEYLEKFMANFHKEVHVLERLNHCNIVRLLCSQSAEPSIIMEFVDIDLRKFLIKRKKKEINLVAAVDMMLQMALGMEYSHEQGVVHRDLKSSNILVCPSRHPSLEKLGYVEVKVTDFGIAKVNEFIAAMPTHNKMGTTRWRAPEVEKGHTIDWRLADTYSFAITCAEILTLQTPPALETPRAGGQRPSLPGDCPDYLRELLERCWDENPKKRPFFKDIVWTLKNMKMHLLLGTLPKCTPSPYCFTTRLLQLGENFKPRKFKTKDLRTLTTEWAESDAFKATVASIERRLELAGSVFNSMKERQKHVIICRTQCNYLVEECKIGFKQVISAYHNFDPINMVDLFRLKDKKLQGLARSLDVLITSLMAAEELVESCSGPNQWKIMALALCAPRPVRQACSKFGYCLWELYWSLYVTRSHLDATYSPEAGPRLLTSLSFVWSVESCKFMLVAMPIVSTAQDVENEHLEVDREEEFLKADEERQFQDCKLLLSSLQNSTLGEPPSDHWHAIGMYLESLCASIWKVPTTIFDSNSLPPKLGAMLRRRLGSESLIVHEPGTHLSQTSAVAFYDLYDEELDLNDGKSDRVNYRIFKLFQQFRTVLMDRQFFYECWGWGVKLMCIKVNPVLLREKIELLARVQHPNIVNLIGFVERSRNFIFEPITTTLEKLIESNMAFYSGSSPFSFPVTLDILLQIVEAMIHVHECGVVHLGLEPKHILVQPKNTIDRFGTADLDLHLYYNVKLTRSEEGILVNPNGPVGSDDSFDGYHRDTSYYMAPELLEEGQRTKFVEVWSFGMTTYHIVSGSCLIESMGYLNIRRHLREVTRGERHSSPAFGAAFPKGSKTLIEKCCAAFPKGLTTLIEKCCVVDPFARISFEEIRKELWALRKKFDIDGLQE